MNRRHVIILLGFVLLGMFHIACGPIPVPPPPTPTGAPTSIPISTETPTVSPTSIPTPTPCSITNMGWVEYQNIASGSTISASPVLGTNCAIKISFTLKPEDWVAAYKKIEPDLLLNTKGIRFSYIRTGAANTLEFKLIERDSSGIETIFYVDWAGATFIAGKEIPLEVNYDDLICRSDTPKNRCLPGKTIFKPELADRLDFSFSNKPSSKDEPGEGEVIIKDIQLIP